MFGRCGLIDPMFLSCYICWERIPYRRGPSCRASDRTSSRAPGRGHFLPETVGIGLGHEWRTFITCALATPQKCSILADLWERAAKGSGRILMGVLCSFKDLGAVVAGTDRPLVPPQWLFHQMPSWGSLGLIHPRF